MIHFIIVSSGVIKTFGTDYMQFNMWVLLFVAPMLMIWSSSSWFLFLTNLEIYFFISLFFVHGMQVENLAERMMRWVSVGGFIFFRESCFHQSGDSKRKSNPTHYREPRFYTKVSFFRFVFFYLWAMKRLKVIDWISGVKVVCSCCNPFDCLQQIIN